MNWFNEIKDTNEQGKMILEYLKYLRKKEGNIQIGDFNIDILLLTVYNIIQKNQFTETNVNVIKKSLDLRKFNAYYRSKRINKLNL